MIPSTIPDYTGDGTIHSITDIMTALGLTPPVRKQARSIQISVVSGSGTGRFGDSNITSTRGIPIGPAYGGWYSPTEPRDMTAMWDLDHCYLIVPTTMTVSITYVA